MLCDCSCDSDCLNDIEDMRKPVARKQWDCCECGEPIEPGQRYQLYTILCEGAWSKHRTCLPCARIRTDLCTCWHFGELHTVIWECLGFDYLTGEDNPNYYPRSYHAEAV